MGSLEDIGIAVNIGTDGNAKGGAIANNFFDVGLTQWGWDCVVIPGAYVQTADTFVTITAAATTANLQQVLAEVPTADVWPVPSSPQICGQGKGLGPGASDLDLHHTHDKTNARIITLGYANNITICSKYSTLELFSIPS